MAGRVRVGVSGWRYAPWRGRFYPADLPHPLELRFAGERFGAIEINGTFYSLQRPERFARWHDETPRGFRFAVKGSRFITHMKRLEDVAVPLANFYASGVLRLEEKLGPFLWQLPADFPLDTERIERFLDLLPRDCAAAARLGRRHDERLPARAWLTYGANRRLEHALEFRHPSFLCADLVRIARRQRVALVFSHTAGRWPYVEELTAGFAYLRLHGPADLYASDYGRRAREEWARRIEAWAAGGEPDDARKITEWDPPARRGRDVWVFFDNTDKVHAPRNAVALIERLATGARCKMRPCRLTPKRPAASASESTWPTP
jgi:uncharacterized protein YecE (DUF72 family)